MTKIFLTLLLALSLSACWNYDSENAAYGQTKAFFLGQCTDTSYIVNQVDDGKTKSITITCTKKVSK